MIVALLIAAMAPLSGPNISPEKEAFASAYSAWAICAKSKAKAWANQKESAETIARGAVAACEPLKPAVRQTMISALIAEGMGGMMAEERSNGMMADSRADLVERVIAFILSERAK